MIDKAESYFAALCDVQDYLSRLKNPGSLTVWKRVVDTIASAVGVEAATYYDYQPKKRHIVPRVAIGPNAKELCGTPVDIRTGLCGWVAMYAEPLIVHEAYKDKRFLREVDEVTGFKTRNVLCIPISDRGELIGVLQLLNRKAGTFDARDLGFVTAACSGASIALRSFS